MKDFYNKAKKLDVLMNMEPAPVEFNVLLTIIRDDEALAVYFYDKCENGEWVKILKEAGEFNELQDDEVSRVGRMKAVYLSKVVEQVPEDVIDIISGIDAKDGFVQHKSLDTLLDLLEKRPEFVSEASALARKLLERRVNKIWYFVGDSAAKVMRQLADIETDKAFVIAEMLLEVWKGEKGTSDLRARFEEYHYQELVFKNYKKLWEIDPLRAAKLLADTFNKGLEELDSENYGLESGFNITIERVDQIGDRFERDIVAILVGGICEIGKAVIEKEPEHFGEMLDYLGGLNKVVFQRIIMYLLRIAPAGMETERINSIIGNPEFLEKSYWWYEYRLLLNDKFEEISTESKKVFENWVEEENKIDEEEKKRISKWFKERERREATDKDFETIENSRKARELFLVKESYPELYKEYKEKSEADDEILAPRPHLGEGMDIAETEGAPITVDEMCKMEPKEAIEYLCDATRWKIDKKKESFFHTPEEGLEGVFEKVAQQRIDDYSKLKDEEIIKLKPIFLKRYFHGAWNVLREKKIEDESLVRFIDHAKYVVNKQGLNKDYEGVYNSIIYIIEGIFEDKEIKTKQITENGEVIWGIIEPLVRYKDEREISEIGQDPFQRSANCVAGKAFSLVVKFGLASINQNKKNYEKQWSARIRSVLEEVIDKIEDERIRCVLGVWFPQVYGLEEKWVEGKLDDIFDEKDDKTWDVLWGSYITWSRPYKTIFEDLEKRGKYMHAVSKIGTGIYGKHDKEPDEGLVEHLMIGFFNSWIEYDDPILVEFYKKASAKLRGKAAGFLTTGFTAIKEKKDEGEIAKRLERYWEERIKEIEQNPEANREEAEKFVKWVKDSPIEAEKTFELLYKTLELLGGRFGKHWRVTDFIKGVLDTSKGNELIALKCLNKAVNDEQMPMYYSIYKEKLAEFIQHVEQLQNDYKDVEEIRKEAMLLADNYGRKHIYDFKDLYFKLAEKAK